jgi:hypothetical protein
VWAAAGTLLLLAAPAAAHFASPESILTGVNAEETRRAWGVERAARDAKVPRLLVIRVGPHWYARPASERRTQAAAWHDLWRTNVSQGITAILDDATGKPVVQFGRGGAVVGVSGSPAATP